MKAFTKGRQEKVEKIQKKLKINFELFHFIGYLIYVLFHLLSLWKV